MERTSVVSLIVLVFLLLTGCNYNGNDEETIYYLEWDHEQAVLTFYKDSLLSELIPPVSFSEDTIDGTPVYTFPLGYPQYMFKQFNNDTLIPHEYSDYSDVCYAVLERKALNKIDTGFVRQGKLYISDDTLDLSYYYNTHIKWYESDSPNVYAYVPVYTNATVYFLETDKSWQDTIYFEPIGLDTLFKRKLYESSTFIAIPSMPLSSEMKFKVFDADDTLIFDVLDTSSFNPILSHGEKKPIPYF